MAARCWPAAGAGSTEMRLEQARRATTCRPPRASHTTHQSRRNPMMHSDSGARGAFPTTNCRTTRRRSESSATAARRPLNLTLARRPLLPEGPPAAPATRPVLSADRRRYTRIVTIPTTTTTPAKRSARRSGEWPFLTDPERTVSRTSASGVHRTEHTRDNPNTLLLSRDPLIHCIYNGYWFRGRPPSMTSTGTHAK